MRRFIQWLLVGFSAFMLLGALAGSDFLVAICLAVAIAAILPFTKPFLENKLPFLQPAIARIAVWAILLFIVAPSVSNSSQEISVPVCNPPDCNQVPIHSNSREIFNLLKEQIGEYTSIPNLQEQLSDDVTLDGKVVIVNTDKNEIERTLLFSLPESLVPIHPEEVKYVVWFSCTKAAVGTYTDGATGYQQTCEVKVIDRANRLIVAKETFAGGMPDQTKTHSGDSSGGRPDGDMRGYLISLANENQE